MHLFPMRPSPRFRLGVAFVTLALALRAADQPVQINPQLAGAWFTPAGAWDGRVVLLLHGFADDMDGAGDLTKRLAADLAAHGIASLRINFRGEGDKQRTNIESTFQTRLEDTAAARAWLEAQAGVKPGRMGVLGWSLGGATALESAGSHPAWFKSLVLWSSLAGDPFAYWQGSETAQRALKEGVATEDVPGWKKITTKREFYESFRGYDLDKALAKYPGAFLTIRGSGDFLPQHDAELVKLAAGRPAEAVLIGGADHTLNVFKPAAPETARVLEVTLAWFERTL
jgi:dienelactone hydrolase